MYICICYMFVFYILTSILHDYVYDFEPSFCFSECFMCIRHITFKTTYIFTYNVYVHHIWRYNNEFFLFSERNLLGIRKYSLWFYQVFTTGISWCRSQVVGLCRDLAGKTWSSLVWHCRVFWQCWCQYLQEPAFIW